MRDIKFRVWTGSKMEHNIMAGWLGAFYVQGIDPKDSASMSPFNTIYSEQSPVMEYTGLKDRQGVEIYEGDIVEYNSSHGKQRSFCLWDHAQRGWRFNGWHYPDSDLANITVIGNIYENQDLLK